MLDYEDYKALKNATDETKAQGKPLQSLLSSFPHMTIGSLVLAPVWIGFGMRCKAFDTTNVNHSILISYKSAQPEGEKGFTFRVYDNGDATIMIPHPEKVLEDIGRSISINEFGLFNSIQQTLDEWSVLASDTPTTTVQDYLCADPLYVGNRVRGR